MYNEKHRWLIMALLQKPHDFLDDFIARAQKAERFIGMQAMVFEFGHAVNLVEPVLLDAKKRGIDIVIQYDWNSHKYVEEVIDIFPELNRKRRIYKDSFRRENNRLLKRWESNGFTMNELNTPLVFAYFFPVFRRNHTKLYFVDDTVWMGGVNFFDQAFGFIDFMVRFDDAATVEILKAQFDKVNGKRSPRNYSVDINNQYRFIDDAGKIGNSLIYEEALNVVSKAESTVAFVSQLVPEGKMLELLMEKAGAGVKVLIFTSPEEDNAFTKFPHSLSYNSFLKVIKELENISLVHYTKKLHAKLIIADKKEIIFGSHNFVEAGVLLGTEEIAMRSTDPDLVRQTVEYLGEYSRFLQDN